MPAVIDKKLGSTMKTLLKASMKGRAVYFGMQVAGPKEGKFLVNKNAGNVKKAKLQSTDVYVGKGKDEAEAKRKNEVRSPGVEGVCRGKGGTLTLWVTNGKPASAALKFVRYFIKSELKYGTVKKVVLADESDAPPEVDEKTPDAPTLTADLEALKSRLGTLSGVPGAMASALTGLFDAAALKITGSELAGADDILLQAEGLVDCLEDLKALRARAATLQSNAGALKPEHATEKGEIETHAQDALARLTAAEQALGSADAAADVETACQNELAAAEELLEKGEERLEALGGAKPEVASPSEQKGAEVATIRSDLAKIRLEAAQGVTLLASALTATNEKRAIAVAGIITTLAAGFPKQAEGLLGNLSVAFDSGDEKRAGELKSALKSAASEWANYLKTHEKSIAGCEANPFNVPVSIRQPVRDNLVKIMAVANSA